MGVIYIRNNQTLVHKDTFLYFKKFYYLTYFLTATKNVLFTTSVFDYKITFVNLQHANKIQNVIFSKIGLNFFFTVSDI